MKQILMIIAPKEFRDEEYFIPRDIFKKNNFKVVTASKGVDIARGKLGGVVMVDTDISNIDQIDVYSTIVFVGGMGATIYQNDKIIDELILKFSKAEKIIAAICIAPTILAYNGILSGKKATVWNSDSNQEVLFKEKNINYTNEKVTVSGNFITANGPLAAEEFANTIVNELKRGNKE